MSNVIPIYPGEPLDYEDKSKKHTCPYREEILDDYETLCECSDKRMHECAMDV
jgi:hypothetical protein